MTTRYDIRPPAPGVLAALRELDDSGRPPELLVDEEGGSPLRCCFGRSRAGERIALVSYAPLRRWAEETGTDPGPYGETGPVFLHATACGGPAGSGFPDGVRGARRVLRAYTRDGRILRGRYVESAGGSAPAGGGPSLEAELDELYRDPEVEMVHLRAVEFGCFLMETRRRRDLS